MCQLQQHQILYCDAFKFTAYMSKEVWSFEGSITNTTGTFYAQSETHFFRASIRSCQTETNRLAGAGLPFYED